MADNPTKPDYLPECAECDFRVDRFSERMIKVELLLDRQCKDTERLTQELHKTNGMLAEKVKRPEFHQAIVEIDKKLYMYVPKTRYQLMEWSVLGWFSLAAMVFGSWLMAQLGIPVL